jgi:hypothetical protein
MAVIDTSVAMGIRMYELMVGAAMGTPQTFFPSSKHNFPVQFLATRPF